MMGARNLGTLAVGGRPRKKKKCCFPRVDDVKHNVAERERERDLQGCSPQYLQRREGYKSECQINCTG